MQRDDRVIRPKAVHAIGPFPDGQPQKHGIGEQAAKSDDHAVRHGPAKDQPGTQHSGKEADRGAGVITAKQRQIEIRAQIQRHDGREKQAGDGEFLGEDHQPVNCAVGEEPAPDGEIARAHHQKDGHDDGKDIEQSLRPRR